MNDIIKCLRMINGIDNAYEASKLLGISKSYMCMLESGARVVTPELLEKIASVYKIESSAIISISEAYEQGLCNKLEVMKLIIDYYSAYYTAKNNSKYEDDEKRGHKSYNK